VIVRLQSGMKRETGIFGPGREEKKAVDLLEVYRKGVLAGLGQRGDNHCRSNGPKAGNLAPVGLRGVETGTGEM